MNGYTDIKNISDKVHSPLSLISMIHPLQTPPPSPSSPGGRWGWGEEHFQQHHCREPQPGGWGRSGSLLASAAAALGRGGGRRGLLWAVGRSESGQHHGLGLWHFLLPLLLVPCQRGPLWEQRLCLLGQWKQVSERVETGLVCDRSYYFYSRKLHLFFVLSFGGVKIGPLSTSLITLPLSSHLSAGKLRCIRHNCTWMSYPSSFTFVSCLLLYCQLFNQDKKVPKNNL